MSINNIIYSIVIFNLLAAGITSSIYQDYLKIKPLVLPGQRSELTMRGLDQMASAEYNFFMIIFSIFRHLGRNIEKFGIDFESLGSLSLNFADQVEQLASKNKCTKITLLDFDRVINGARKAPGIDWSKINNRFTDYSLTLDFIEQFLGKLKNESELIHEIFVESELKRLQSFAQGTIDYRSKINIRKDNNSIELWTPILDKLDQILNETHDFLHWSNLESIKLYKDKDHKGPCKHCA